MRIFVHLQSIDSCTTIRYVLGSGELNRYRATCSDGVLLKFGGVLGKITEFLFV